MSPNRMASVIKRVAILCLVAVLLTACGSSKGGEKDPVKGNENANNEKDSTKVIAVYKTEETASEEHQITQGEFDGFMAVNKILNPMLEFYAQDPEFQKEMLKQYIAFRIFSTHVEGDKLTEAQKLAEEDYTGFIAMLEQGMGGKDEMKKQLDELGATESDIKNYITLYTLASEYLKSDSDEAEAKKEFDEKVAENPAAYVEIGTVSHILIATEDPETKEKKRTLEEALKRAEEVREELLAGADFAEMAKEYSDDTGSAANGGTMKDAELYRFVEPFRDASLELPLHEISEPVETVYGYHIIRVDDRVVPTFEEVKEMIISGFIQEKFAAFMEDELPGLIVNINLPEAVEKSE